MPDTVNWRKKSMAGEMIAIKEVATSIVLINAIFFVYLMMVTRLTPCSEYCQSIQNKHGCTGLSVVVC